MIGSVKFPLEDQEFVAIFLLDGGQRVDVLFELQPGRFY